MKKKIAWLVVSSLLVLALLAAACGGEEEEVPPAAKEEAVPAVAEEAEAPVEMPKYGGRLTWACTTPILAWDEAIQAPWTTGINLPYTNEELIQGDWTRGPGGSGEVPWNTGGWMKSDFMVGALAESWEFPDDETMIFNIRKGVHWHDKPPVNGREFTADDVVYNIKRIYFDIPSSTMWGMAGVSRPTDVYATDKYTVVVKAPPGQLGKTWEYVADWTRMFPPEVIEQYGDHNAWENVTGTGPFMLTDYVPMSSATWTRNADYWMKDPVYPANQLPYLDSIKLLIIVDMSTMVAALRTGKIDTHYLWSNLERHDALPLIESHPELQYFAELKPAYYLMGMRVDKPDLPFDDIKVRRALHMAVNNQEIVDTYHGGLGAVLVHKLMPLKMFEDIYTPVAELPPAPDGFESRKLYEYHPEEARQLLAEAGYPDGFQTEVVVINAPTSVDEMTMVKAYWEKIGVDLKLDVKEAGTFYSIYQKKTHKEGLYCGRWGDQPYDMFTCRVGNMYNWAMIDDPKMEAYYDQMSAAYFQPEERDKIMKEANLYIVNEANYLVPPVGYRWIFWWPWLKRYHGDLALGIASYYGFKYVWIDQDLKKQMGY